MVTRAQLCEHLTPAGLVHVPPPTGTWKWLILSRGLSFSKRAVRLDRVDGGYEVTHGNLRDLRAMPART